MKTLLAGMLTLFILSGFSQTTLTPAQWKEDVHYLLDNMARVHINPYHSTDKKTFENFVANLDNKIDKLSQNEIIVELMRMVAMVKDGHTAINFFDMHRNGNETPPVISFHVLPISTYAFDDGIFIIKAADEYKDLIGKKILQVGKTDVQTYYQQLSALMQRDNDTHIKFNAGFFMNNVEIMNGLGAIDQTNNVQLTVDAGNGKRIQKNINPVEMMPYIFRQITSAAPTEAPLYRQDSRKFYWYKWLEADKTLYIAYNVVQIDPNDTLANFCKRINEFVNANDVNKVVVDIRNNGGGNNGTCKPLVDVLRNNPKINRRGHLYTIIGRQTFSAASYFTTKMELQTETIFVGEPTGAKPNHYGDNRPLVLPNSKLEVRLSSIYWNNSIAEDNRVATMPDLVVANNSSDYFSLKDPVLETILKADPQQYALAETTPTHEINGTFLFSPTQKAVIQTESNKMRLKIDDVDAAGRRDFFINTVLYPAGENKFRTAIKDVSVMTNQQTKELELNYKGTLVKMPAAPNGYQTPGELFAANKNDEAFLLLDKSVAAKPYSRMFSEQYLNAWGYRLMNDKNTAAAIKMFRLMVEKYPNSANAFDSLGEGYATIGDKGNAVISYEKALTLDPNYPNAVEAKKMLEKLK
ncbi:MAG: hypothetical protein V4722_08620 [Bacteroidota bacterium]